MIEGIQVRIDGKLITIPFAKAKELYEDLDKLFGKEPKITYPITNPITIPVAKAKELYIGDIIPDPFEVTCSTVKIDDTLGGTFNI